MRFDDYKYLGISKEARIIFDDIARQYTDKIDIELDFATLAIFAENTVRLSKLYKITTGKSPVMRATKHSKDGIDIAGGNYYLNPLMNAISMCEKQINLTSAKLGLTPDARRKIAIDLMEIELAKRGRKKSRRTIERERQVDAEEEFC